MGQHGGLSLAGEGSKAKVKPLKHRENGISISQPSPIKPYTREGFNNKKGY
jgi:hypothetical protein